MRWYCILDDFDFLYDFDDFLGRKKFVPWDEHKSSFWVRNQHFLGWLITIPYDELNSSHVTINYHPLSFLQFLMKNVPWDENKSSHGISSHGMIAQNRPMGRKKIVPRNRRNRVLVMMGTGQKPGRLLQGGHSGLVHGSPRMALPRRGRGWGGDMMRQVQPQKLHHTTTTATTQSPGTHTPGHHRHSCV